MGTVLVEVVTYDPKWLLDFERIREALATALSDVDVVAIEHVGSTAVPGLAAKPVIDVDVVVERVDVPLAVKALCSVGYADGGDKGIPDRRALAAPDDDPLRHVYVCVAGSLALRNHLAVRDLLRRDDALRSEYAAVKLALAAQELDTMDEYVAGKNAVLARILTAAGLSSSQLTEVASVNPQGSSEEQIG